MANIYKVKDTVRCMITVCLVVLVARTASGGSPLCTGNTQAGRGFKYIWGDALSDPTDCIGPTGQPYPTAAIARMFRSQGSGGMWGTSSRSGRGMVSPGPVMAPHVARKALLRGFELSRGEGKDDVLRAGRGKGMGMFSTRPAATKEASACSSSMPGRLCKTRYNTTAPMYGVSLTSGQPVTIVQKFPDLLQQVVFEVCESNECEVVRGECTQTYVPYLFLVIPLGPVTLTGQDYVLVESGCVCRPQHGGVVPDDGLSALPPLPNF